MRTTVDMLYARADWQADARWCLSKGWGHDNYEDVFEWVKTFFEVVAITEKLEYTMDDVEEYARQVYDVMGTMWDTVQCERSTAYETEDNEYKV